MWTTRPMFLAEFTSGAIGVFVATRHAWARRNQRWPIAGIGSGYLETTSNQIRDFIEAIVQGGTARPNFADGLHVQQVVDAVLESVRTNTWVEVLSPYLRRVSTPGPAGRKRGRRSSAQPRWQARRQTCGGCSRAT